MNKKLKFSWAHIIAFVALIFYAYLTFVGATYLFNCKFWLAGIVTFVLVTIVFLLFIGVQQVKGTDEKFPKSIKWERVLMVCTIVFYIASLHPFIHVWHVQKNHIAVEKQFKASIKASKQLFVEYEKYSEDRISRYSELMDRVIGWKGVGGHTEFSRFGFVDGREWDQKNLRLQTLRLQLLSSCYDTLKRMAFDWIESADKGASVWNIFLVGNIDQIKSAVNDWEERLQSTSFSGKVLADEEFDRGNTVYKFDETGRYITATRKGLDKLRAQFTVTGYPSYWGYITAILCYLALIFPYIIQSRNTKNHYRLFGYAKGYDLKKKIIITDNQEDGGRTHHQTSTSKSKRNNENSDDFHVSGGELI